MFLETVIVKLVCMPDITVWEEVVNWCTLVEGNDSAVRLMRLKRKKRVYELGSICYQEQV